MAVYTTIDDPSVYFQVQLYTGNGSANHAITLDGDTDLSPAFVWIKNRDAADSHCLFNTAMGATKILHLDTNAAEATDADTLDSFTSDGFQVDADVKVNTNTEKYVAFCWKGGTTSGITTNGSTVTTPTAYSFDQTGGFSTLKFTGNGSDNNLVAHGLGKVPKFFWVTELTSTSDHGAYHNGLGNTHWIRMNTTGAQVDNDTYWSDADPDNVNITLGSSGSVNSNTLAHWIPAWSEIQGYSKFGVYEGNGNADGTFVYTGFRPAWVMIKRTNATYSWAIYDAKRYPENLASIPALWADANTAEGAYTTVDFLSNGFKIRDTSATINTSGGDYIFMAFAEAPFVNSNGVPCNAR